MKMDIVVAKLFVCWTVVFVPITASYHDVYFSADSNDVHTYIDNQKQKAWLGKFILY